MAAAPLLGVETEYAFTALDRKGRRADAAPALKRLLERAQATLPCLPGGHSSGIYLANGSRLYVDAGGHPELSTPECADPWDVVRYALAGDRILAGLAADLVSGCEAIGDVVLTRANVDYSGSESTWGCHESYLYRGDPAVMAREIVPHLVSRIVYTGAGGFDNRSAGVVFTLSPRVPHLLAERSDTSTCERGIFHTKDEALCRGDFHRLHLLCGESVCSRLAAWLKLGATALVVAMIEAGVEPGCAVRPSSPLRAMQRFAADPTCRAETPSRSGVPLAAIAIQRHYLAQAEAHLGATFMPGWAEEVCRLWRATLDALEGAPTAVDTRLDWAIKLPLFRRHAERRGVDWASLARWTVVAQELVEAVNKSDHPGPVVTAEEVLSKRGSPVPDAVARLTPVLERDGLRWDGLRPFLDLRQELFEIDTRFSQLGDRGIFQALDRAGALDHELAGIDAIDRAVEKPPASGRARLRGEAIRALCHRRHTCAAEWQGVWDHEERRTLDLRDPFVETPRWQSWPAAAREGTPAAAAAAGTGARSP